LAASRLPSSLRPPTANRQCAGVGPTSRSRSREFVTVADVRRTWAGGNNNAVSTLESVRAPSRRLALRCASGWYGSGNAPARTSPVRSATACHFLLASCALAGERLFAEHVLCPPPAAIVHCACSPFGSGCISASTSGRDQLLPRTEGTFSGCRGLAAYARRPGLRRARRRPDLCFGRVALRSCMTACGAILASPELLSRTSIHLSVTLRLREFSMSRPFGPSNPERSPLGYVPERFWPESPLGPSSATCGGVTHSTTDLGCLGAPTRPSRCGAPTHRSRRDCPLSPTPSPRCPPSSGRARSHRSRHAHRHSWASVLPSRDHPPPSSLA